MAALPYIQLYVADYLADTQHLSMEEHGAYLLIIFNYWQRGKPPLDDDRRLASICSTSVEHWLKIRSTIEEFFNIETGFWVHERIEKDLEKVHKKTSQASQAGKASAAARLEKQGVSNGRSNSVERKSNHTDTDTDTDKKKKALSDTSDDNGDEPFYLTAKKKKLKGKRLETFNLFWDAFAFKAGKAEAADSWLTIPTLTDSLVERIVSAAKMTAASREGIIKKGSTPIMAQGWLTKRRWEDESSIVPSDSGEWPTAGMGGVKPPKNAAAAIARKLLENKYGTQPGHNEQRNHAVEPALSLPAPGAGGPGDPRR